MTRKGILYQYNEEIDGAKKESFTLESSGKFSEEENKARELAKVFYQCCIFRPTHIRYVHRTSTYITPPIFV